MFKEVDAQTAVNALIDGNEDVFVITHVDGNVKIARLNDFSINILVDPQLKDGYRYILDDDATTIPTPEPLNPIPDTWHYSEPWWGDKRNLTPYCETTSEENNKLNGV